MSDLKSNVVMVENKTIKNKNKQTDKKTRKNLVLPYLRAVGLRSLNRHFQIECLISHFRPHLYGKEFSRLEGPSWVTPLSLHFSHQSQLANLWHDKLLGLKGDLLSRKRGKKAVIKLKVYMYIIGAWYFWNFSWLTSVLFDCCRKSKVLNTLMLSWTALCWSFALT